MIRTAWHDLPTGHRFAGPAPAGPPGQTAARPAVGLKAAPAGHWLSWRRLPPALELVTLGAGYAAPSLAELYHAQKQAHLNVEPYLNHLVSAHDHLVSAHAALAVLTGHYYGTVHFILTRWSRPGCTCAEAQGGWENGRIAALVPESYQDLAPKIARHGADEDKHGRIFSALLRQRGLEPVSVSAETNYTMLLERIGPGLTHSQLRRDNKLTGPSVAQRVHPAGSLI